MGERLMQLGKLAIIISGLLFLSAASSWSKGALVKPMASDSVLRVLYYGGIKGNITPCG